MTVLNFRLFFGILTIYLIETYIRFGCVSFFSSICELQNAKFDVDLAPINTDIMTDDIKKIYKELGVNCRGTLIFGDTARRPWSLQFDRDFLIERSTNINAYTVDIVKK